MRVKMLLLACVAMMLTGAASPVAAGEEKPGVPLTAKAAPDRFTNTMGMSFLLVRPGEFVMGSPRDESGRRDNERPHRAALNRGFYLQSTEVTQAQWEAVMGANPSQASSCGPKCPVENVSWNDVHDFIKKLNFQEDTTKYRLPTEAEWEYACRAGAQAAFYGGDIKALKPKEEEKSKKRKRRDPWDMNRDPCTKDPVLEMLCWYCDDSGMSPHPVGQKKANPWGFFDMSGNVAEFCEDWFGEYPIRRDVDPAGPAFGKGHVLRGGSWQSPPGECRSAYRQEVWSGAKSAEYGFRLARDL